MPISFRPILRRLVGGLLLVLPTVVRSEEATATTIAVHVASRTVLDQCRRAAFNNSTYWTSQPGALRSFDRTNGALQSLHKLYSSPTLTIVRMEDLESDMPLDWADHPSRFVDLNEPRDSGDGPVYPIVDPRADAEGFSFSPAAGPNPLPLPVPWLYLTADGTLGTLNASNQFVPILNPTSGVATAATPGNPMVARVAWWADDATCKVNINTASEGVFWDSPRCDTAEERAYARFQPARGEWQRDMGHPAAVCLSSVLFPGRRLHLPDTTSALEPLPLDSARLLWRATPGIPDAGSLGGTVAVSHKASGAVNEAVTTPHQSPADLAATVDLPEEARTRLNRGHFFLTARSRGLEATRDGQPRISLWPIATLSQSVWNQATYRNPSPHSITEFDCLMAAVSTHHSRGVQTPMAVVRLDPNSRHNELYALQEGSIYKLAQTLLHSWASLPHPEGSFEAKYGSSPTSDAGWLLASIIRYVHETNLRDPELAPAAQFLAGQGFHGATSLMWSGGAVQFREGVSKSTHPFPIGIGATPTVSEVAFLVSLRNFSPAGQPIESGTFFQENQQLATSLGNSFDHFEVEVGLLIEQFSPAQLPLLASPPTSFTLAGKSGGFTQATRIPNTVMPGPQGDFSIGDLMLCGKRLVFPGVETTRSTSSSYADSPDPLQEWGGFGGSLGVRTVTSLIAFRPMLFSLSPGAPPPDFAFSGTLSSDQIHLRLIRYSTHAVFPVSNFLDSNSLIHLTPLAIPPIDSSGFQLPMRDSNPMPLTGQGATGGRASGKGTRLARARAAGGGLYGENGLIHPEHDIVISMVPNHGDFRLLAGRIHHSQGHEIPGSSNRAREFPTFVAHPNFGTARLAHSLTEPLPASIRAIRGFAPTTHPGLSAIDDGYFARGAALPDGTPSTPIHYDPGSLPDFPVKPWSGVTSTVGMFHPIDSSSLQLGAIRGGQPMLSPMTQAFAATRYDSTPSQPAVSFRGAAQPDATGDFDNGLAATMDGPYINAPDPGDSRAAASGGTPYFEGLDQPWVANPGTFSPYRHVASAMMLGSLPTGVLSNVPWQTLLFRPDPHRGTPAAHFGSTGWPDHLVADFFRMPVVKPSSSVDWNEPMTTWMPSDAFSTEGRININPQLIPFFHVQRTTALHALFKAQKLLALPDEAGPIFKTGAGVRPWRRHIDATETLRQWADRFASGDVFRTSSEIATQWLVPEGVRLENVPHFWARHRLTGDNSKERPYANIYPHLTTKSLTYDLHIVAEPILKSLDTPADTFVSGTDSVGPRHRRSITIQGRIDPQHPGMPNYARAAETPDTPLRPVDSFIEWTASSDAVLPPDPSLPRWIHFDPVPNRAAVDIAWSAPIGGTFSLETSPDLLQWTTEGRFQVGDTVDTTQGITQISGSPNETRVRLAVPTGTHTLYARLRRR